MPDYKMDKTAFKMQTFKEADKANIFDENTPYGKRLEQAYYLTLQAYGYSLADQPCLDRTCFSMRKLGR